MSNNLISQSDASALAGVSIATLMRFAEAGYFRTYSNDGETQFSKIEICQVFGPAIGISPEQSSAENKRSDLSSPDQVDSDKGKLLHQRIEKIIENTSSGQESLVNENSLESTGPREEILTQSSSTEQNKDDSYQARLEAVESLDTVSMPRSENTGSEKSHDSGLEPFKQVLRLQEELLAQKDIRIEELTKERDWLRSRLEQNEEQSDRFQMLLMVESQKVRTLIGDSNTEGGNKKPGLIRQALSWLGGSGNN